MNHDQGQATLTHEKKGEWCPVFKRDDRQDKKNYRPITLLCLVNKVYEQLLSETSI